MFCFLIELYIKIFFIFFGRLPVKISAHRPAKLFEVYQFFSVLLGRCQDSISNLAQTTYVYTLSHSTSTNHHTNWATESNVNIKAAARSELRFYLWDPPTSTEIVNIGAWTGPVMLTVLYVSPGRSSFRAHTAFFGWHCAGLLFLFFLAGPTAAKGRTTCMQTIFLVTNQPASHPDCGAQDFINNNWVSGCNVV